MRRRRPLLLAVLLALSGALAWAGETGKVVATVDGDTIKVDLAGHTETVRLIGIDTPETVHPQKPVEYFGKEASAFTRSMTLGKVVRLEDDSQDNNRDKYGRLLRYVFLPDGKLLNAEIIAQGYGFAYTRFPFMRLEEFRALERQARDANRGLWGGLGVPTANPEKAASPASAPPAADGAETVYVTRTGTKYHRAGCRFLAKSTIPIALKTAAGRYGPCSVCAPPRIQTGDAAPGIPIGPGAGATLTAKTVAPPPTDATETQTVYVTRTGTKYHRAGCRYLAKSQIPLALAEAAARYSPCSVCSSPTPSSTQGTASPSPNGPAPTPPQPSDGGRCQAITKAGSQCKRNAAAGSRYCWQHGG